MLTDIENLEKWSDGIEMVCSLGHLALESLVRNPDKSSKKAIIGTTGIVGYTFINKTGEVIDYLTEDISLDETTGKYVGKQVVKQWLPNTEIDLTKVYTTHLLKRPELNCKCKNARLIFGTNSRSKTISDRINLISTLLQSPTMLANGNGGKGYNDEDIAKLKVELNSLANELANTAFMRCTEKGKSVHDDRYKVVISAETKDGYKITDPRYIKTFGLLNNSISSDVVKKLNTAKTQNTNAQLLNKVDTVISADLLKKLNERSKGAI